MLQKLTLTNYQSHEKSTLELGPHLNAIVGASDKGKSSILRAIDWGVANRPGGDAFRRRNTESTSVEFVFDNTSVIRSKGKGGNTYQVGDSVLSGFGQGVPDEVTKAVNFGSINIQRQFDGPFLLTETAGEVARRLNEIADLGIIDSTIANNNKELRETTREVEICAAQITSTTERLKGFTFLDELEPKLVRLQDLEDKNRDLGMGIRTLEFTVAKLKEAQSLPTYSWVPSAEQALGVLESLHYTLAPLGNQIFAVNHCLEEIAIQQGKLQKFPGTQIHKAFEALEKRWGKSKELETDLLDLQEALQDTKDATETLRQCISQVQELEELWTTEFPDECPLCNAPKEWWYNQ